MTYFSRQNTPMKKLRWMAINVVDEELRQFDKGARMSLPPPRADRPAYGERRQAGCLWS